MKETTLPVRSLQQMLNALAERYTFLPRLKADGVFGEHTLEAVMLFQRELHPPVTGQVDRGTWEAIQALWRALGHCEDSRTLRVLPSEGYRALHGTERDFLILPQTMFQVLARHFSGLTECAPDGCHSGPSVDNVRWLQRAGSLEPNGVLDADSWALLCRLYEIIVVWEPDQGRSRAFRGGWG